MRPSLFALLITILLPSAAQALDTWETFDPMWVGIDMGLGGGLAVGRPSASLDVETSAGTWIYGYLGLPGFSAYGWVEAYTDGDSSELGGGFGLFGTPIDTAAFDLDLGFELATFDGSVAPSPWVELNLDFKPDMELAGLFARANLAPWISPAGPKPDVSVDLNLTAGAYLSIDDDQLLLAWRLSAGLYADGERSHAVAAGWNAGIADWGELLTEVELGLPVAKGEPVAASAFLQLSIWFDQE